MRTPHELNGTRVFSVSRLRNGIRWIDRAGRAGGVTRDGPQPEPPGSRTTTDHADQPRLEPRAPSRKRIGNERSEA